MHTHYFLISTIHPPLELRGTSLCTKHVFEIYISISSSFSQKYELLKSFQYHNAIKEFGLKDMTCTPWDTTLRLVHFNIHVNKCWCSPWHKIITKQSSNCWNTKTKCIMTFIFLLCTNTNKEDNHIEVTYWQEFHVLLLVKRGSGHMMITWQKRVDEHCDF